MGDNVQIYENIIDIVKNELSDMFEGLNIEISTEKAGSLSRRARITVAFNNKDYELSDFNYLLTINTRKANNVASKKRLEYDFGLFFKFNKVEINDYTDFLFNLLSAYGQIHLYNRFVKRSSAQEMMRILDINRSSQLLIFHQDDKDFGRLNVKQLNGDKFALMTFMHMWDIIKVTEGLEKSMGV